jgi:SWI/SNF-related matrix-associated actin-dependent regulator of chromatin subfamily A member 5
MYDFFYTLMKNELKPFIEKKTLSTIRDSCSSTSPSRPERPDVEAPSIRQPTCILNGTLRSYQLGGLEWLMYMYDNGMSPILGDEMGLGKTLQTISFLAMLKESRNVGGPHLVIVPLSVMSSWMNEFRKWCPSLRVVRVHSSDKRERERIRKTLLSDLDTFDVVVTTYDYLTAKDMKSTLISRIHWRVVVFDEGHKLKNPEAQLTCAARNIKSQCILLLTGMYSSLESRSAKANVAVSFSFLPLSRSHNHAHTHTHTTLARLTHSLVHSI